MSRPGRPSGAYTQAARVRRVEAMLWSHARVSLAELAAGVVVLTDAELDDELAAHAADIRSELETLLARPIPATPEARALYLSQLASRLAHAALDAAETDPAHADARESYADDITALLARLCAVWGSEVDRG